MNSKDFFYLMEDNFYSLLDKAECNLNNYRMVYDSQTQDLKYTEEIIIDNLGELMNLIGFETDDHFLNEKLYDELWDYLQKNKYKEAFWLL